MRYSYWPYKEPLPALLSMERGEGTDAEGKRLSRHVFSAQWGQAPKALGGNIIHGVWFPRYRILPKLRYRKIYADTAQKTKERNDFSVFACDGLGEDGKVYRLDQIRNRWESPQLKREAIAFWQKHAAMTPATLTAGCPWLQLPPGMDDQYLGQLRKMVVEDKSSGTGLVQDIRFENAFPIQALERHIDKLTRVMDASPWWEQGFFCVPEFAPFTSDFIAEAENFTADDTHAFDDQIDTAVDSTMDLLSSGNKVKFWERQI